jgi:hypothetical protein
MLLRYHHLPRLVVASLMALCGIFPFTGYAQSVWTGGSALNDSWMQGDNWTGAARNTAVNAQNHLVFGQSARYSPAPDLDLYFSTITFTGDAEQGYTFAGKNAILSMSATPGNTYIYNNSRFLVTIENDLELYSRRGPSGTGATDRLGNIVAQYGDILWSGNSVNLAAVTLRKGGRKALILTGDHAGYLDDNDDLQGGIEVLELHAGTLVMDVNAGFKIREDVAIEFEGNTYHMNAHLDPGIHFGSGSTLHVMGKSDSLETTLLELGSFRIGSHNSPMRTSHRIIVDSNGGMGTTLRFSSVDTAAGNGYSPSDLSTLNVVLDADSKLEIPLPLVSGRPVSYNITVTTPGGLTGGITGLATVNGDEVVRNTTFTDLPNVVDGNVNNATAYRLVGDALFSRTNVNNNNNLLLTLGATSLGQGGSFNLHTNPAYQIIGLEALLMEEGAGDYHIGIRVTKGARIIHQYSQHGTLYFNAGIDTGFAKTGPGAMVVSASAVNEGTGSIHVQEGLLVINSDYAQLGNSGSTTELRRGGLFIGGTATGGGTLAGAGTLGDGVYGNNLWARIHVHRGGTLDGTAQYLDANDTRKSLTIRGDLYFYHEESIYKVDLHADNGTPLHVLSNESNPSDVLVTLNGDLQLSLQYAPLLNDIITLMTWETGFNKSGQFLTINGAAFSGDNHNEFSLSYNGNPYEFELIYGASSVYLNVIGTPIPEPATMAALFGAALAGMLWFRRKR